MNPMLVSEEKEVHVGPKGSQTQQTNEEKRKKKDQKIFINTCKVKRQVGGKSLMGKRNLKSLFSAHMPKQKLSKY